MSWLSKNLKKLKAKDLLKGIKTVTGFVPGGDLIRKGISEAEKNYNEAKKSTAKKQAEKTTIESKVSDVPTEKSSNILIYAIAGIAVLYFIMK